MGRYPVLTLPLHAAAPEPHHPVRDAKSSGRAKRPVPVVPQGTVVTPTSAARPTRYRWLRTLPLLAALCFPAGVRGATVEVFSPQGTVKDVRQVAVRFSGPMVACGDPRLPEPFDIDCAARGRGRWADTRNWVYDFESSLPAGLVCRFTLREGLKSFAGGAVTGRRQYSFDTGGPSIRASLPMEGDYRIDAEQVFVLALDASAGGRRLRALRARRTGRPLRSIPTSRRRIRS